MKARPTQATSVVQIERCSSSFQAQFLHGETEAEDHRNEHGDFYKPRGLDVFGRDRWRYYRCRCLLLRGRRGLAVLAVLDVRDSGYRYIDEDCRQNGGDVNQRPE